MFTINLLTLNELLNKSQIKLTGFIHKAYILLLKESRV